MWVLQEIDNLSRRHIFSERSSHEFEEDESHSQLSTFYKSQESTSLCELCQFLSTFHSRLFEEDQSSHSNDQEAREIRMNCRDRESLQSFQEDDDKDLYISSLRSNQTSHSENRLFRLRQCKSSISVWRRKSFAFRDLL